MKKLLSLLISLILVFTLIGCSNSNEGTDTSGTGSTSSSSNDTNEKDTSKNEDSKEKITIWAWDPNFNIAIMEEAKAIYQKDNPDVEIEVVEFAKGDLEQKLHTNLASGKTDGLPDIVLIEDYNSQKYLQAYPGSFEDLTGKINHDDFAGYKVALMTVDGKVYGVPFDSGVTGFYYRTDYLEEAGYTAKDLNNITWDEFIEIGKDVLDKTGKQMLATDPNDGGLMRTMMNSAGRWYFDENGNVDIANNEAIKEAARLYSEIVTSGIAKITSGWGEWVGALNNGDVASITTGVWITASVKAEESQSGLWAVAPTPRLDLPGAVNASNLGGSSWYVLSSSQSKDTAIDFLNKIYAGNNDFYQKILFDRGAVGTYIPSQAGEAYTQEDPFFGGQAIYTNFSEWMQQTPSINYGMYTYEADAAIMAQMAGVYEGLSVDEALKAAEEQVVSQIQ